MLSSSWSIFLWKVSACVCVCVYCEGGVYLFVGQCFDVHTGHPTPGLEYVLGTETRPELFDTIVMANLVR